MVADDPWVGVRTTHDLPADEVISALQKSIRRSQLENAALLAYEMYQTSAELEEYLWLRLQVISVEDVGSGSFLEPVIVDSLYRMHQRLDRPHGDRFLFAVHAIRCLVDATKDRMTDELANWVALAVEHDGKRPEIPDVALDMHTARGRSLDRGLLHFLEEAAQVTNERSGRDDTYRRRLLAAVEDGSLS
jgi:replication-associated recombination protein RarA